jgi:hypothetical protein
MSTRCEKVELPHHIWRTLAGDLVGNVDTVGCLRVASLGYHGEKSLPAKVSQQGWSPTTQSALLEHPQDRAFGELLINCEEDRTLRAELVGMPREAERLSCRPLYGPVSRRSQRTTFRLAFTAVLPTAEEEPLSVQRPLPRTGHQSSSSPAR